MTLTTNARPLASGTGRDDSFVRLVDEALRGAVALGLVLVVLLPEARGSSETVGWWPLWLIGMPASALWALRGCPVMPATQTASTAPREARRRRVPQARRRARVLPRRAVSRAA